MKKLLALCLVASTAFAGERFLGFIRSGDTTKSNISQNPDGGSYWADGGYLQPFCIPDRALITVRCTDDSYVCTDKVSCNSSEGLELPSGTLLPTSVGGPIGVVSTALMADGGFTGTDGGITGVGNIRCAGLSVLTQTTDGGWHVCKVWERMGNE